jgi:hypothetical protein
MKAYNHEFTSSKGNIHDLGIVDFENGNFKIFWGNRPFGCRHPRAAAWVEAEEAKALGRAPKKETNDSYYYRRRRGVARLTPANLLAYVKHFVNQHEADSLYSVALAADIADLNNY